MDQLSLRAMGKINLGLDVLGKREDGYHEVRMIMQSVRVYDKIFLSKTKENGISIKTNRAYLPTDENNLVYKAAKLLMDEFGIEDGVEIDLKKFIPVAAGMAGGSSDAAAVLYGMNRMFGLKLDDEQLMKRGVLIGADVPYCIMRGTVLSEGIGEILTPLKNAPDCHIVIAKPAISVSTKHVYEAYDSAENIVHPDIDGMIEAINAGDLKALASKLSNVLENVTGKDYPIIGELEEFMKARGALGAIMSGSGPTVFGLYDDENLARATYDALRQNHMAKQTFITECFNVRR